MTRQNIQQNWREPQQASFRSINKHNVFIGDLRTGSTLSKTLYSTSLDQLQRAYKSSPEQALYGSLKTNTVAFDKSSKFLASKPRPNTAKKHNRFKNASASAVGMRHNLSKREYTNKQGYCATGCSKRRRLSYNVPDAVVFPVRREDAEAVAFQEFRRPFARSCRVYWTDAAKLYSGKNRAAGAAVVYHNSKSGWIDRPYKILDNLVDSGEAELFAISKALQIARDDCIAAKADNNCPNARQVLVYSDLLPGLESIKWYHDDRFSMSEAKSWFRHVQLISKQIEQLQRHGILVQLRWVPGHAGVPGNVRADTVARHAIGLRPIAGIRDIEGFKVEFLEMQKLSMRLEPLPSIEEVATSREDMVFLG